MQLTYICKHCGEKSKLPAEAFENSNTIICPECGKSSGNTAQQSPQVERFSDNLNVEQEQAATYDGTAGGIMLLAGAGCGKTRTMIARALFLLKVKKVRPERIAMLTFTRRAAKEIEDRLAMEVPEAKRSVFVGTFHRFCLSLMHRYPAFFKLNGIKIMDNHDQDVILKRIRNAMVSSEGPIGSSQGIVPNERNMASVFSYANNKRISVEDYYTKYPPDKNETVILMKDAYNQYAEYKQKNGYMDFDDILSNVTCTLETDSDFRRIVQNSLDHVLVDEMQDTSQVQWDILKAIYPPVHLFCVGDDAQSIYSFRGADFESVHHFCDLLPNSITLKLTENYRSTQQILDIANMLMDDSPLGYGKNLHSHSGEGKRKPRLYEFYSEEDEASFVVGTIAQKLENGTPPNEIMVLLRSTMNGRMLEHNLRTYGIPYRLIGGVSFMQAAHIKDTVAVLEALTTPKSELAWMRFLMLLPRIGFKSAEKLYSLIANIEDCQTANKVIWQNLMAKNPDAANFIHNIFDPQGTPEDMLRQIIDFLDSPHLFQLMYDNIRERRKDLETLVKVAKKHRTVASFLEAFKLDPDSEVREQKNTDNLVTLITVHSAKGTEADVCFVLRTQPGTYPHYKSKPGEEEEDRRILYVAMTRARKELYLTVVNNGYYPDSQCSFINDDMQQLLAPPRRSRKMDF